MTGTTKLHIGIAGAGSAGLATAIAFARMGHKVTVLEKHRSLAPLGAGLLIQPQGIRALQQLGLKDQFENVSLPIRRLLGESHRGWRIVDIAYDRELARSVSRDRLAQTLFYEALASGVAVAFDDPVEHIARAGDLARVETLRGAHQFDLFVLADGAASTLRTKADLAAPATPYPWGALWGQFWVREWEEVETLKQRYRGPREMMGLMPTQVSDRGVRLSLFWSLRCDQHQAWRAAPVDAWKEKARALWAGSEPVLDQIRSHDDLSFAVYRHSWPRRLANGPFVTVGDAAHALTPQLGLGTTLAVQDAIALAETVDEFGPVAGALAYERARRTPVRAYQTLSRALTPCFQSNGWSWPRDVAFAAGRRVPGIAWVMKRSVAY